MTARRLWAGALLLAIGVAAGSTRAQEIHEQARVRALELMVALEPRSDRPLGPASQPALSPTDFELTLDGEVVTVLGIDQQFDEKKAEPWKILVYIDATLSSTDLVRSATGLLAGAASQLARLGTVEVVLADPTPHRLLAAESDEHRISAILGGLSLRPPGSDQLVALRSEALDLSRSGGPQVEDSRVGMSPGRESDADGAKSVGHHLDGQLATAAVTGEFDIIGDQSDRLLIWLDQTAGDSPRRVLFLVSGGFDPDPAAFYSSLTSPEVATGLLFIKPNATPQEVARVVAADNWITFAMRRPEPDPLPRRWGLRRSLLVRADGNWDPRRAEAQLELGESLIRQEKWQRAEDALRSATYHFYAQPKLRPRQAEALLRLAYVLEQQGRDRDADKVTRQAIVLDPSVAAKVTLAGLLDPIRPLVAFADATSGGLISDSAGLSEAISGLSRRLRLEYQVGTASGEEAAPLTLTYSGRRGLDSLAPRWSHQGPPPLVAAARARRLLDEDLNLEPPVDQQLSSAGLQATCQFLKAQRERPDPAVVSIEVAIDPRLGAQWAGVTTRIRLTAASLIGAEVRTSQWTGSEGIWQPGDEFRQAVDLAVSSEQPEIAIVIEEMTTERWLATRLSCLEPDW